jgi:hypothetical protein
MELAGHATGLSPARRITWAWMDSKKRSLLARKLDARKLYVYKITV